MHTSENAARYLTFVPGEPTQNLLKVVRQELRADIRSALYQALQSKTKVHAPGLSLRINNHTEILNVHVQSVPAGSNATASGFMLVVFEPVTGEVNEKAVVLNTDEPATQHLEEEVLRLKAQLRASNEQHEFAAEELKAGNEELQAMNEELRSATEELETSKEELQSINEELSTVNQELKVKIEEATMVSNNLQNLINSTDIGTIFLDRSYRVVLFTPAARLVYNLISADHGRPLSDITSRLGANTVLEDAETVLEKLQRVEREAYTTDGRTLIIRMAPYRTEEDSIKGVVISLLDITERKQAEDKIRMAEEQQTFLVQLGDVSRNLLNPAEIEAAITQAAITKFAADRCYYCEITDGLAIIRHDAAVKNLPSVAGTYELAGFPMLKAAITAGKPIIVEDVHSTSLLDEETRQLCLQLQVISFLNIPVIKDSSCVGALCLVQSTPRKWTETEVQLAQEVAERTWVAVERARAAEAVRQSEEKYRTILVSIDEGFTVQELVLDEQGNAVDVIYREVNPAFAQQTGLKDAVGKKASEILPALEQHWLNSMTHVYKTGEPVRTEGFQAGLDRWITLQYSRVGGPGSRLLSVVFQDITERKRAEQQQAFLLKFSDALRIEVSPDAIACRALDMVMQQLHLDRCYIGVYRLADDRGDFTHQVGNDRVPPVPDGVRLSDFPQALQAALNGTLVIDDVEQAADLSPTDRLNLGAMGMRSIIAASLREGERLPVWSIVAVSASPRHWKQSEITLLEELTERTWAVIERAKAVATLQESETRLRITMETALDYAIINMNEEGIVEGWSRGAERTFGWSEAEVLGKTADIIFTPEDRAAGAPDEERSTAVTKGSAPDERWHIRKNGTRFYMSGVMRPVYEGSQLHGFLKVARDLTGRQQAEEMLRISEERYRAALQSADMAAWDWNVAADMIIWNDQHYTIFGLEPDGKPKNAAFFFSFVHPEDAKRIENELADAVKRTGIYSAEFRIIRADTSEIRWMSGYGRAIVQDEQTHAIRMVGVMYDITDRKRLEQQKEEFIGVASHELRTPVTSIKAYAEILEEQFTESGDEHSATLMRKMGAQVDRLISLIYTLLDTTRISGGKLELQKAQFGIDELVIDTAEQMQRIADGQHIQLQLQADVLVYADRERIRQVLVNLIGNAIKYAPGTERILVLSEANSNELKVSVQDYGTGITEAEQQKIFAQFYRAGNNGHVMGLGLGLYISASIIREHGGRIWVESSTGKGALFCFTLPL